MKKSDIIQLVKETIKEGFRDPEDNYGFGFEGPDYYDAYLYFEELAKVKEIQPTLENFANFLDEHTDSIPDSLLSVMNKNIAERRKRYGQHDYYGNNVGGRNSISGMPGVWEEENEPKGHWSAGLEAREIADSFTFDEIEQLYKDGLIDSSNYNGAKWILQGWIDQHPTYLPQRDLTSPKRQRIRDKYLNENKMKKIKEATYAGKTAIDDMTDDPAYNALDGDAKMQLKKDLSKGGTATLEGEQENSAIQYYLDEFTKDVEEGGRKGGTEYLNDLIAAIVNLRDTFEYYDDALAEYMKERGDSNLMEHMDKHRKRTRLMEGAVKRLFIDFDQGKTNEEIVQDYATKGIQIPDSWISQMRKEWEGFEKMKLNLDIGEKEFKNAATQIVNNPEGSETGMEPPMESKQLASGLSN